MHTKAPGKQKPHGQLQKASNFGQEVEKNAAPSVSHKKTMASKYLLGFNPYEKI